MGIPASYPAVRASRYSGRSAVGRGLSILLARCPRCRPPGRPRLPGSRPGNPGGRSPVRLPSGPIRTGALRLRPGRFGRRDRPRSGRCTQAAPTHRRRGRGSKSGPMPTQRPACPGSGLRRRPGRSGPAGASLRLISAGAGAVPHRPGRGGRHRPVVCAAPCRPTDHRRPDHRRWRRARPGRRVRVRRPGRADGPGCQAAGEGHRHPTGSPAGTAMGGRYVITLVSGPRPARSVLGLRGLRPREGDERDRHAADDVPGRADGHRRLVPAARRGRLLGPGRAPPPVVRDLVLRSPGTPTWRSRWRSATSSPTVPRSAPMRPAGVACSSALYGDGRRR